MTFITDHFLLHGETARRLYRTFAAPLQVFRRGEPLALMPNVFVR